MTNFSTGKEYSVKQLRLKVFLQDLNTKRLQHFKLRTGNFTSSDQRLEQRIHARTLLFGLP